MPTSPQTNLLHRAAAAVLVWAGLAAPAGAAVSASVVGTELRVASDGTGDAITLRLVSGDTTRLEVVSGAAVAGTFLRSTFTTITVDAGGGDDTVTVDDASGGVFSNTTPITIGGGDGNDTILGGIGAETVIGGPGNDTVTGRQGNDVALGGDGDDRFLWNPGDGSDVLEGQAGTDTLEFHGSNISEIFTLSPNGGRALFTRNVANIVMDVGTTERLELTMLGGIDLFNTLAGLTTLTTLDIDAGDGADTVVGGAGNDHIVGGTAADLSIDNIQGGGGDDVIDGGGGDDTLSGGDGNDTILGGVGVDTIAGDAGDDVLSGNQGNDIITGGSGNDRMTWVPGDASDVIEGQVGTDTLDFDGSNASENVTMSPNGGRVSFFRDVAAVFMDLGTVERIDLTTLGGTDTITIAAGLDGLLEQITLDTGVGNDTILTTATSATLVVNGGPAELDTLHVNLMNQVVDAQTTTIAINGALRITYADIESLNFTNPVSTLPAVTITAPTSSPSTTSALPFIAIAGTAADAGGIQAVTWSNDRGGSGTAAGTTAWSVADIALQPGTNTITVSALDTNGNRTSDAIAVVVSSLSYSLAEGATGTFFDLDVSIANPSATPAPVTVTFLRQDGSTVTQNMTLAATSRTTLAVDTIAGLENQGGVSTVVTSTTGVALVTERTMFWDASRYGSHGGSAVDGPRTRWLFAEGSEGFFNTYVLLANPGGTAATATLTFLREGSTPFVRVVNVPATSRVTLGANGIPELVGRSFSIVVDADAPILAERAMYFGTARLFDGGHESAGVPAGAMSWFLAEGATGSFFTTFVLVGNPNPAVANVTLTYLTDTGQTVVRNKTVPANGRLTVNIATEDPSLANVAVSTTVTADQPVVAERAMYWPGLPSTWAEAHNSFGATTLGTKWGLAEGRVGMAQAFQTYILLANPSASAANVRITFLRANGSTVVKTFTVNPTSRYNVHVNSAAPELVNETFGALVEVTNGVGISVERALYSDALGQTWAAGTNALATRLP